MSQPTASRRALSVGVLCLGLAAVTAGCSTDEQGWWSALFDNIVKAQQAQPATPVAYPSDESLARLRACESNNNYQSRSRGGRYRGAYQFSQQTWNNVARSVRPDLVNVDPAAAPADVQDQFARELWAATGWRSWPVCGRRA